MTVEAKNLLDEALELSNDDRRRLAEALLDSMPPETAEEIELAWLEEARTRAGKLERGEIEAQDGAAAVAALEAKLRQVHAR